SARGPLQVTELALKDLEQAGVKLQNDINTLEGKIEAGVAYLKLLRDRYKLSGDELIAAYFSGPTYVRNHGITDEVQYGQISNREYGRRYKEALDSIRSIAMEVVEPPEPARPEPTETPPRVEVVREPAEVPEPLRPAPGVGRPVVPE